MKRLPKGFGQISHVKQNLRCPYRAMVTLGKGEDGKYNRKIIGYYSSYDKAYSALEEYHVLTFHVLFNEWFKINERFLAYPKKYKAAFKALSNYHDAKIDTLNFSNIMLPDDTSPSTKEIAKDLIERLQSYKDERRYYGKENETS